jgi:lipopolysaccharide/colanic/teichoic acid biosynthesis glycosyltransferase
VLLAGPALLPAAAVIRIVMGAPVLFRQDRLGHEGRVFSVLKFRTMQPCRPAEASEPADAARLTWLGSLLRRWSFDELPQLWNVLRGEMSLVGPRPLPVRYESRYTPRQRLRQRVKPGLTGWAQIHGRNRTSWRQRFEHDVWYTGHATAWLDFQILWRTARIVASGAGVSPEEHALMPEFSGESRTL